MRGDTSFILSIVSKTHTMECAILAHRLTNEDEPATKLLAASSALEGMLIHMEHYNLKQEHIDNAHVSLGAALKASIGVNYHIEMEIEAVINSFKTMYPIEKQIEEEKDIIDTLAALES